MMKIRDEELLDYVDGTLDAARRAQVETHLAQDAELSAMLAEMPLALAALHDWDESESTARTRDLWPQIRKQLPARAGSPLGRMLPRPARRKTAASTREAAPQTSWVNALFPARSPWKMSARLAAVAAFVALAALALSPRGSVQNVKAEKLTSAEQTFIQQSVQRHAAYETVRSVNGATLGGALTNGDGRSSDGDDEPDDPTDAPYAP